MPRTRTLHTVVLFILLCGAADLSVVSQGVPATGSLSAPEVIGRLEQKNADRLTDQPPIVCTREYTLDYRGFPDAKHAEMTVRALTTRDGKSFTILKESGSEALRNHVLHKLLEGEREAFSPEMQSQTRISRENDEFRLEDVQGTQQHPVYVLDLIPRRRNKFVWRGRIWVDGVAFAVVRAQGSPEKMPSWWTTSSSFSYTNQQVNDQWIPEQNTSVTQVRFGGHAQLVINYGRCQELRSTAGSEAP